MSLYRGTHQTELGPPTPGLIGSGAAMQDVYRLTRKVARTNASVLLLGETGTGKELIATAVHRLVVERRPGCFHVTNQGAVSWFEFARSVLEAAGLDPTRVEPITTADLDPPRPAPRPANSVLDNAALRLCGLPLLPHYTEPLAELVKELDTT